MHLTLDKNITLHLYESGPPPIHLGEVHSVCQSSWALAQTCDSRWASATVRPKLCLYSRNLHIACILPGMTVSPDRPLLIVEDDANTREGLATLLSMRRYDVITAANGAEALQLARVRHPCLILLDLVMPVMDGEEFRAEQLKDDTIKEIPVVVLSAKPNGGETAKRLGALAWVPKPIDFRQVVNQIAAHCHAPCPQPDAAASST
jgi:CheY-like chemotaxis protein